MNGRVIFKEQFLSSLTGLDFVLVDDSPAINGWAITKDRKGIKKGSLNQVVRSSFFG
jgi:hypothetical protein